MLGILNDKQRVAVIGIFFATLLCFFGLANSYWSTFTMYSKAEQREISYRMGLWQVCQEVSSFKDCKTLGFLTTTSAHNVIRMCAVVCLMLGILSVVAVFDTVYEHHTQNTYITAVTAFVGGIFGIIAVCLYAANSDNLLIEEYTQKMISYSWALGVFASGAASMTLVSGIACYFSPTGPLVDSLLIRFNIQTDAMKARRRAVIGRTEGSPSDGLRASTSPPISHKRHTTSLLNVVP